MPDAPFRASIDGPVASRPRRPSPAWTTPSGLVPLFIAPRAETAPHRFTVARRFPAGNSENRHRRLAALLSFFGRAEGRCRRVFAARPWLSAQQGRVPPPTGAERAALYHPRDFRRLERVTQPKTPAGRAQARRRGQLKSRHLGIQNKCSRDKRNTNQSGNKHFYDMIRAEIASVCNIVTFPACFGVCQTRIRIIKGGT